MCRENSSFITIGQENRILHTKTNAHFLSHLAQFYKEWEMFQTKVVGKFKTPISCTITFFFENRAFYEIMWKNIVELDKPQMTIWGMRIACWLPKATNTLKKYNTYYFSTATMVAQTGLGVTLHVLCLSCCLLSLSTGTQLVHKPRTACIAIYNVSEKYILMCVLY